MFHCFNWGRVFSLTYLQGFEHTSAMTKLLHEAKINHKDLTVVWLDLANAYGYIPPSTNTSGYASVLHPRPCNIFMNY